MVGCKGWTTAVGLKGANSVVKVPGFIPEWCDQQWGKTKKLRHRYEILNGVMNGGMKRKNGGSSSGAEAVGLHLSAGAEASALHLAPLDRMLRM